MGPTAVGVLVTVITSGLGEPAEVVWSPSIVVLGPGEAVAAVIGVVSGRTVDAVDNGVVVIFVWQSVPS